MRLGSVKKSQQTKSNPLPPAVHVTMIMMINIHSTENITDDLECDELKAPRRLCFKNRNEIENSCLPILDLGAEAQKSGGDSEEGFKIPTIRIPTVWVCRDFNWVRLPHCRDLI